MHAPLHIHECRPPLPAPAAPHPQVETKSKVYAALLKKYNRLIAVCDKHGVNWHRELDGKKDKKQGGRGAQAQQAQQAQPQAQFNAANAGLAAAEAALAAVEAALGPAAAQLAEMAGDDDVI